MAGGRTTLREVAESAGLSTAAVSQILNGRGNFAPGTRARVVELAAEMGYRPNPLGRSLASGRSHLLAICFSQRLGVDHFFERDYIRQVYLSATQEAMDRGYTLILGPPSPEHAIWNRIPVEGVLLVSPRRDDPVVDMLTRLGVPVVMLGRDPVGLRAQAEIDYDIPAATRGLLQHLRNQGARRIAYVGVEIDDSFTADVESTYNEWCGENGFETSCVRASLASRPEVLREMLTSTTRPDAIFGDTWEIGQQIVTEAQGLGIGVPDELMVAAFGDSDPEPGAIEVTTVRLLPDVAAIQSMQLLVEIVEGKSVDDIAPLPYEMHIAASTRRTQG